MQSPERKKMTRMVPAWSEKERTAAFGNATSHFEALSELSITNMQQSGRSDRTNRNHRPSDKEAAKFLGRLGPTADRCTTATIDSLI